MTSMKRLLVCAAVISAASVVACTPVGDEAAVSLAGRWEGTIICYKVEAPLTMTIDAAKPNEASMSMGEGGALSWHAAVTYETANRVVAIKGDQPTADAAVIAGPLSADGKAISGTMDKQLCTDFKLTRAS